MSLDPSTSIDFLKTRVDKTLSIQEQIAGSWLWPIKTVAEWQADSIALDKSQPDSLAAKAITAATRADSARGKLDQRLAEIHRQTLAVVGVTRVRAQRSPEHAHVVDDLSARGDSRRAIGDEGAALLSAWSEEFSPNFTPAPELTFDGFQALFTGTPPSLRDLKQALSAAATVARRESGRLNALLTRVGRDSVDWYAEATSIFPETGETGALIRAEIPTTTQYNPPTPAPVIPPAA